MVFSTNKALIFSRVTQRIVVIAALLFTCALLFSRAEAHSIFQTEGEAAAAYDLSEAADAAVEWLIATHQNDDGGYTSFSTGAGEAPSDVGGALDALLAIAAAGGDTADPLNYLKSQLDDLIAFSELDGSTTGKVVLALVDTGEDPQDFGYDFVQTLSDHLSPDGDFGVESAFGHSLAILALEAAGEPVPDSALTWLSSRQENEGEFAGSWDDGFGTAGNPDATAMAIMALMAAAIDAEDDTITAAELFLMNSQLASGGWEYGQGFGENANSTALVIRALASLGQDPGDEEGQFGSDGVAPVDVLLGWQGASGAFQADFGSGPADDFFATVQSIPAAAQSQLLASDSQTDFFGGDSLVPYFMLGLVAIVLIVIVVWYVRANRQGNEG